MSVEELKKDVNEFVKLIEEASRQRVKETLQAAKHEVENEIIHLEMKAKIAEERKAAGDGLQKRYLVELTEYAWDQSDKFVKLFVTLEGVQNIDHSQVTTTFAENSMNLLVQNLNGKDFGLTVNNLLYPIDLEKSYHKVKTGLIAIYMKKRHESQNWAHLTTIQERLKKKQDNDYKADTESGEDALVNIMKKMYKDGDSKTKQMIAKAWTESQEKARTGPGDLLGSDMN